MILLGSVVVLVERFVMNSEFYNEGEGERETGCH